MMRGARSVESWGFLVVVILVASTSLSSSTINPVLVGLFVDRLELTLREAGLVTACEAAGYALGHLAFVMLAHRWDRRATAFAAVALVIVMNQRTIAPDGFGMLAAIRLFAGFGMGLTLSVTTSLTAARRRPAAAFSITAAAALLYAATLVSVAPAISARFGMAGLVYVMMALGGVGLMASLWLPSRVEHAAVSPASAAQPSKQGSGVSALRLGFMLMLLYAGHNALWSYQERIGVGIGLSPQLVGQMLGVSILGAIVGALLVLRYGTRLGATRVQTLSLTMLVMAALAISYVEHAWVYVGAAILLKAAWFFSLPALQGSIAELDPSGRYLVAAGLLQTLGSALGPAAAAFAVPYGYSAVGWVAAALYLLCIPVGVSVLRSQHAARDRSGGASEHGSVLHS